MINRLPENCTILYADLMQKMKDNEAIQFSETLSKNKNLENPNILSQSKMIRERNQAIFAEQCRLVAMLGAGGAHIERGRPLKILSKMANAGLFSNGGILVGSFAFGCYANMLGFKTEDSLTRTSDIDFSLDRRIEIAFTRSLYNELQQADSSFHTPLPFNKSTQPFEMIASDGFKVEFLTSKNHVSEKKPILIDRFNVYAQPLSYMDFLMEDTQQAIIIGGSGIPVKVPHPARFALHKLAISTLRSIGSIAKSKKDIAQAAVIIDVLLEDMPGAIIIAANEMKNRDDFLSDNVLKGISSLPQKTKNALTDIVTIAKSDWDVSSGCVFNA